MDDEGRCSEFRKPRQGYDSTCGCFLLPPSPGSGSGPAELTPASPQKRLILPNKPSSPCSLRALELIFRPQLLLSSLVFHSYMQSMFIAKDWGEFSRQGTDSTFIASCRDRESLRVIATDSEEHRRKRPRTKPDPAHWTETSYEVGCATSRIP